MYSIRNPDIFLLMLTSFTFNSVARINVPVKYIRNTIGSTKGDINLMF